jgi:RNA recognition motif-containing protein
VTADLSPTDILNHVKGGAVEALRILTEKGCAFVDFCDDKAALLFWNKLGGPNNGAKRISIRGVDLRVGWAKPSAISVNVSTALKNGATRNLYFGGLALDGTTTLEEVSAVGEMLRAEVARFGIVEHVKVVPERQCAFVHLTTVADAMRAVSVLAGEVDRWGGKRVSFGRDRCAMERRGDLLLKENDRTDDRQEDRNSKVIEEREEEDGQIGSNSIIPAPLQVPIRTIYLGGVPVETTAEDICNVIRGGMLEKIRLTLEKRCAFVTFVEASAAVAFYEFASNTGVFIKGARLKPGWGQASVLPGAVTAALRYGATRNVYIGNIDLAKITDEEIKTAFSAYGPIELVNFLRRERNVAFVGYCMLLDAVKAVDGARKDPLFMHCDIGFGKDRCAQPLRSPGERYDQPPMSPGPYSHYPYDPYSRYDPYSFYHPPIPLSISHPFHHYPPFPNPYPCPPPHYHPYPRFNECSSPFQQQQQHPPY